MEFILASSNVHKVQELNSLLENVEVKSPSEKLNPLEDGDTFQENAFKKAKTYHDFYKAPALADDSGLVVEALPNMLGVQSARFAPEFDDYKDKNDKLLELMASFKGEERKAYFVCYLCFYISETEVYFFEGRLNGKIGASQKGEGGFGYDPIFAPEAFPDRNLAEIPDWKMENSHRAKACQEASIFFKN
ncbi:MAG: non-canonical purine NTP pyrophosphatase [Bacteriovoracaceae bacterium]